MSAFGGKADEIVGKADIAPERVNIAHAASRIKLSGIQNRHPIWHPTGREGAVEAYPWSTPNEQGASRYAADPWYEFWLPFVDTYRTLCKAPDPALRRVFEDVHSLQKPV